MKKLVLLLLITSCTNKAKIVWYNPDYCFEGVRPYHFKDRKGIDYQVVDDCGKWNYESKPITIKELKKL